MLPLFVTTKPMLHLKPSAKLLPMLPLLLLLTCYLSSFEGQLLPIISFMNSTNAALPTTSFANAHAMLPKPTFHDMLPEISCYAYAMLSKISCCANAMLPKISFCVDVMLPKISCCANNMLPQLSCVNALLPSSSANLLLRSFGTGILLPCSLSS